MLPRIFNVAHFGQHEPKGNGKPFDIHYGRAEVAVRSFQNSSITFMDCEFQCSRKYGAMIAGGYVNLMSSVRHLLPLLDCEAKILLLQCGDHCLGLVVFIPFVNGGQKPRATVHRKVILRPVHVKKLVQRCAKMSNSGFNRGNQCVCLFHVGQTTGGFLFPRRKRSQFLERLLDTPSLPTKLRKQQRALFTCQRGLVWLHMRSVILARLDTQMLRHWVFSISLSLKASWTSHRSSSFSILAAESSARPRSPAGFSFCIRFDP